VHQVGEKNKDASLLLIKAVAAFFFTNHSFTVVIIRALKPTHRY
jgi:hypothetical protein